MSHGLMFHHFHGAEHPEVQGSISAADLTKIIEYTGPQNILCAHEWMQRLKDGTLEVRHCCLTFDDALKCQIDIALPVLKNYNLTGLWFISTSVFEGGIPLEIFRLFRTTMFENVDNFYSIFFTKAFEKFGISKQIISENPHFKNYLHEFPFYSASDRKFRFLRDQVLGDERYSKLMWELLDDYKVDTAKLTANLWLEPDHIRSLANDHHIIGLHSDTHPTDIARLSLHDQLREYQNNADKLTSITGVRPKVAAYPCNSYNSDSKDILSSLGIEVAFRSNMESIDKPNLLEIPREDHTNIMAKINA